MTTKQTYVLPRPFIFWSISPLGQFVFESLLYVSLSIRLSSIWRDNRKCVLMSRHFHWRNWYLFTIFPVGHNVKIWYDLYILQECSLCLDGQKNCLLVSFFNMESWYISFNFSGKSPLFFIIWHFSDAFLQIWLTSVLKIL